MSFLLHGHINNPVFFAAEIVPFIKLLNKQARGNSAQGDSEALHIFPDRYGFVQVAAVSEVQKEVSCATNHQKLIYF